MCPAPFTSSPRAACLTYILAPPDFDGPVLGGGVEQAISPPLHTRHRLRVAREDFVTPAHQCVPDADAAILGGTGEVTALWVSGQKEDQIHLHRTQLLHQALPPSAPEDSRVRKSIKDNFLFWPKIRERLGRGRALTYREQDPPRRGRGRQMLPSKPTPGLHTGGINPG